ALGSASTGALGEAPTVITSTGATTRPHTVAPAAGTHVAGHHTQAGGNEARTLLADEATKVRSGQPAASVVTAVQPAGGNSRKTWIAAAVVVLLIVGGVAGFFINRARRSGAAASLPSPTPAPSAEAAPTTSAANPAPTVEAAENANPTSGADKRAKQTSTPKAATKPSPQVANQGDASGHD